MFIGICGWELRHLELRTDLLLSQWQCTRTHTRNSLHVAAIERSTHAHISIIQHEMQVTHHIHTNIRTIKKELQTHFRRLLTEKYSTPKEQNEARKRGKKKKKTI